MNWEEEGFEWADVCAIVGAGQVARRHRSSEDERSMLRALISTAPEPDFEEPLPTPNSSPSFEEMVRQIDFRLDEDEIFGDDIDLGTDL